MTRHIKGGHKAFYYNSAGPMRPSQIRRAQQRSGNRWCCIYCGAPQFNRDAAVIHQRVCPYRDPVAKRRLLRQRWRRGQWERLFDRCYDVGYVMMTWMRRLWRYSCGNRCPVPPCIPGPPPTTITNSMRLLDSVASKYGRPGQ